MKPFHYFEQTGRRLIGAAIALLFAVFFAAVTVTLALTPSLASCAWASGSLALAAAIIASFEIRAARRNYRFYTCRK